MNDHLSLCRLLAWFDASVQRWGGKVSHLSNGPALRQMSLHFFTYFEMVLFSCLCISWGVVFSQWNVLKMKRPRDINSQLFVQRVEMEEGKTDWFSFIFFLSGSSLDAVQSAIWVCIDFRKESVQSHLGLIIAILEDPFGLQGLAATSWRAQWFLLQCVCMIPSFTALLRGEPQAF